MPFWEWSSEKKAEEALTKKLREYFVKNVKIAEADQARARSLVRDYIKDQIIEYCKQNSSLPILRIEYTGSVYERLKTEAADEVDIMVVLKTDKPLLWGDPEVLVEDVGKAGYALLKARDDSRLLSYANSEGYIDPKRLRNGWFCSLVVRAVNAFNRHANSDVTLKVRYHGPAVQVDITEEQNDVLLLSVDLVPCFEIEKSQYFVPKSSDPVHDPFSSLLWRQSFSLDEKALLKHMDKDDNGCRHELLRIAKSIVKWQRTSLGPLESYHVKSAFVHYITKNRDDWDSRNSRFLGKHFLGFLRELQSFLEKGNLPIYWLPEVNLLEEINPVGLKNMANRLKRILNSAEAEIDSILSSRIHLECLIDEDEIFNLHYTSHLDMPQLDVDGEERSSLQAFILSGVELVVESVQDFLNFAIICISFVLKVFNVILFCFLTLLAITVIIEVVEKAKLQLSLVTYKVP